MPTVFVRSILIYLSLTLTLHLCGKRQIGELETAELVTTLLLSELATVPILDHNVPLSFALLPMLLIVSLEIILSYVKNKSSRLKRLLDGTPSILVQKGELQQRELARLRLSAEELLGELRLQGVASLADVYYAILEQNGRLSVILRQAAQPGAQPAPSNRPERGIAHGIVIDGKISPHDLQLCGKDRQWLRGKLQSLGVRQEEVFLLLMEDGGDVYFVKKEGNR